MKRKDKFIFRGLILFDIIIVMLLLFFFLYNGTVNMMIGTYAEFGTDSRTYHMILSDGPVVMWTDDEDIFEHRKTGDLIFIVCTMVRMTYPGSTHVYFHVPLFINQRNNLPQGTVSRLEDMGYHLQY